MSATAVEAGSAAAGASLAGRGEDVMEQKGLPNALFLIAAHSEVDLAYRTQAYHLLGRI